MPRSLQQRRAAVCVLAHAQLIVKMAWYGGAPSNDGLLTELLVAE
jgi:hypothetical protein